MGIFEKFHKPEENKGKVIMKDTTKKELAGRSIGKKVTVAGASVAMLAGGIGNALAEEPSLNNLEPKKLSPEYQEKQPSKTITERAAEKGIEIDPTSIEDLSNKDNIPPDGYIFDSATNSFILDVGNKNSGAVKESIADQDIVDETMEEIGRAEILPESAEEAENNQSEPMMNAPQDNSPDTKLPTNNATESNLKPQSSLEQVAKLPIEEIPSDPEEIEALIKKTVQTLAALLREVPNMFTKKHFALLAPILVSALNADNTANATNLNEVYKNLNPDSSHAKFLSAKEILERKANQDYITYLKWQEQNMFKQDLSSLTLRKYAEEFNLDEASYKAIVQAEKKFKANTGRVSLPMTKYPSGPATSSSILKGAKIGSNYKSINQAYPFLDRTSSVPSHKKQKKFKFNTSSSPVVISGGINHTEKINTSNISGNFSMGGIDISPDS